MTPFLTLVTRHMLSRPTLYAEHCASLEAQTDQDYQHLVIEDATGSGWKWAQAQFEAHKAEVLGDYVLQLDDDDVLARPDAIAQLRAVVQDSQADIIVYRVDHLELGVLPSALVWGRRPICGHIGGEDFAVRREIWLRHIYAHNTGRYESDYDFMAELWRHGYDVHWLDVLIARCLRISRGRGE
jgi:hypothetical protein